MNSCCTVRLSFFDAEAECPPLKHIARVTATAFQNSIQPEISSDSKVELADSGSVTMADRRGADRNTTHEV